MSAKVTLTEEESHLLFEAFGEFATNSPDVHRNLPVIGDVQAVVYPAVESIIAARVVEALRGAAERLNVEGLGFKPGGWASNPADQQTIAVMTRTVHWLRDLANEYDPDAHRMTSTVTPPCADATQAEQLGRYSSADRLHEQCHWPTACSCPCHRLDA